MRNACGYSHKYKWSVLLHEISSYFNENEEKYIFHFFTLCTSLKSKNNEDCCLVYVFCMEKLDTFSYFILHWYFLLFIYPSFSKVCKINHWL